MSDPRENGPRRQLDKLHIYREIVNANRDVQQLRRRRAVVTALYEHNRAALQNDPTIELQPFPFSELELDIRRYPVRLSRAGELYTADLVNNPHLPRRPDVPGALRLTPGDLHAAAQWGMLPQLEIIGKRSPQDIRAARATVDFVEYQTILRRLFFEKHLYDDQIWDYVSSVGRPGQPMQSIAAHLQQCPVHPVIKTDIDRYSVRPSVLAERICFTLLSRLGGRLQPAVSVFQPRAGVDRFKKVDILARVDSPDLEPGLIGIDVTLTNDAESIWNKVQRVRPGDIAQVITTTDPSTGKSLPVHRDVVVWPLQVLPQAVLESWQAKRGTTTLTPEYMVPPNYRELLSRSLLKRICTPNGERLYNDETMATAYAALYSSYEQSSR